MDPEARSGYQSPFRMSMPPRRFYTEKVGFDLDHDIRPNEAMRVVQMTPTRLALLGRNRRGPAARWPPARGVQRVVQLVVEDIELRPRGTGRPRRQVSVPTCNSSVP